MTGESADKGGDEIETTNNDFPNLPYNNSESGTSFLRFLERKWLKPYIDDRLRVGMNSPILMETPGGIGKGYPAEDTYEV